MSLLLQHRLETELLLREQSKSQADKLEIARWILEDGYYPEAYVIPPCFKIKGFSLSKDKLETKDYDNNRWKSYDFATLSFPKTGLIQRVFSAIHPKRYHDIVWELMENWDELLDKLFDSENKIISYSFPLAISKDSKGKLRSGRMIYEFLEMAEKDLVAEAHKYNILGKVDITNFYNSVYTHTISWAWIGDRKTALNDSRIFKTLGTKLDGSRMPVILPQEMEYQWLNPIEDELDVKSIQELIRESPDEALDAYTVRRLRGKDYIGNVAAVSEPYAYDDLKI